MQEQREIKVVFVVVVVVVVVPPSSFDTEVILFRCHGMAPCDYITSQKQLIIRDKRRGRETRICMSCLGNPSTCRSMYIRDI